LNDCPKPLDPLEIEALASGAGTGGSVAADHAARCGSCGEAVESSRQLDVLLSDAAAGPAPIDLADRVLRLRPFSRAERKSLAVWRPPLLLLGGLVAAGSSLVSGIAGPREQGGFAAAFAFSLTGLLRASWRWLLDVSRSAPAALEALSQTLAPTAFGWAALLLLLPAGFALRRVLSRAFARK